MESGQAFDPSAVPHRRRSHVTPAKAGVHLVARLDAGFRRHDVRLKAAADSSPENPLDATVSRINMARTS